MQRYSFLNKIYAWICKDFWNFQSYKKFCYYKVLQVFYSNLVMEIPIIINIPFTLVLFLHNNKKV